MEDEMATKKALKGYIEGEHRLEGPEEDGYTQLRSKLRVCYNARIGEAWRTEMHVGGGIKRPRPRLDCSAIGDEEKYLL
jgi:hypothetical protein